MNTNNVKKIQRCICCDSKNINLLLDLNVQPLANSYHNNTEKLEKLVEDLESKFPPLQVHPKEELPSIMYRAGQASVVQYIKQILDEI